MSWRPGKGKKQEQWFEPMFVVVMKFVISQVWFLRSFRGGTGYFDLIRAIRRGSFGRPGRGRGEQRLLFTFFLL